MEKIGRVHKSYPATLIEIVKSVTPRPTLTYQSLSSDELAPLLRQNTFLINTEVASFHTISNASRLGPSSILGFFSFLTNAHLFFGQK